MIGNHVSVEPLNWLVGESLKGAHWIDRANDQVRLVFPSTNAWLSEPRADKIFLES